MGKKKSKQEKRGRGRPTLEDGSRKSVIVGIRMSEDDRELLNQASDGKISDWARKILLTAAKRKLR